ncbi:MAG: hypothetical protein ACRDT6_11155 [Micromonosporaceae bacterium]
MNEQQQPRKWDSPRLVYETGRRVQAVALTMLKHQIVATLGVCAACGRSPVADLPLFGPRCDVAVAQWRVTWLALHRMLDTGQALRHRDGAGRGATRATGRAPVPPRKGLERS